jgi:hypothetical protein
MDLLLIQEGEYYLQKELETALNSVTTPPAQAPRPATSIIPQTGPTTAPPAASPRVPPTVTPPGPVATPPASGPTIPARPTAPPAPSVSAGAMVGRVLGRALSATLILDIENAFNQYARDAEYVPQNLRSRFNSTLNSIRTNIRDHNNLIEQLEAEADPAKRTELEADIAELVGNIQSQRQRLFEAAAELDRFAREDYPRRQAALGRRTTSERIVELFPLMSVLLGDPVDRTNLENIRNPTNYTEILERTLAANRVPEADATEQQQTPAVRDLTFSSGVDQRINPEIASKVQQIEGVFGKRLTVSSGFRDPARNARVGGARNSAHTRGNAVDLVFSGNEEDTIKLIEKASAAGIGGIGVYRAGWVHLDTENKRVWGRDFSARSIPQWARAALNAHMTGRRDGERQQPVAPETPSMEPHAEPASGLMAEGGGAAQDMAAAATPQQQRPQSGAQVLSESQDNAVAERTPTPPTVIQSQETPAGEASPGAEVGGVFQSADDPGPVEPDDAATRYARLFNMAA